jgi:signal transduction histidine kinase
MRIKTRLRLNSIIILTFMMLSVLFLNWSFREVATAHQHAALIAKMQKSAFERTVLRDEYLLHRELRAKSQWLAKTETFRQLLATAAGRLSNRLDIEILGDITKDFEATVAIFGKLSESEERSKTGRLIPEEGRRRLTGQLLVKAYSLIDLIEKLQLSAEKVLHDAYDKAILLLFLFIAFVVLGTIGNSFFLNRLLTKRLTRLREGTEVIGSGRLDFRFPIEGNDELSDLAKAGNEMAAKLQDSHTSINHLQQQIHERQRAEFAHEIISETERVSVIVRNLLQFARQEKQTHSPARIEDIIESVLSLMRTVLRHDQIRVKTDIPEDLPLIKCRSQHIQQVIMNLLTNARDALNDKYHGQHGDKEIEICCRVLEKSGQSWVRVTVGDHGGGIADAIRDRIFDPFFTTKPREQGTGLGLAISHGLVKEHHGNLHFETEPGRGTRFHLDLPVNNGWMLE